MVFTFQDTVKIENLPELRAKVHAHGGSIIQYNRVISCVLISWRYSAFEWVPPSASRRKAGLKHAVSCFLLGWWSITGWIMTPTLVVNNLMGGLDVTHTLIPQPPPLPGQQADTSAHEEYNRAVKRQQWITLITLLAMLLVIALFVVIPAMRNSSLF
jgi:hypothetical protein